MRGRFIPRYISAAVCGVGSQGRAAARSAEARTRQFCRMDYGLFSRSPEQGSVHRPPRAEGQDPEEGKGVPPLADAAGTSHAKWLFSQNMILPVNAVAAAINFFWPASKAAAATMRWTADRPNARTKLTVDEFHQRSTLKGIAGVIACRR